MRGLRWKLTGAFILIVVVSVGLTAILIGQSTTNEFSRYVRRCDMIHADSVGNNLSYYYGQHNGWADVQTIISSQLSTPDERLVLSDDSGLIIADSKAEWVNKDISELGLMEYTSITSSGKEIGRLYPLYYNGLDEVNVMRMDCNSACLSSAVMSVAEQNFLVTVNNNLWLAGLIAGVAALLLGLVLTRQITLPVKALKKGAQHVASGDLQYRVKVTAKDELGELAGAFNSMALNLDKMEQSRKQLTADIAHELRTPLTVIEGTVDGILDGVFKPDNEHLNWIKEQTTLLTNLINDLRDLSLAESGQLKLDMINTDIVGFLERKTSQVKLKAAEKKISIKLDVQEKIPEVSIDHNRMGQVINNLLTNAIRHTPDNGQITISVKYVSKGSYPEASSQGIVISVTDTGEGIPPEHIDNVFNRFYRVQTSRSRRNGETGLGLAIVKQMVEAHGGKTWVQSTPGSGSQFFVFIPLIDLKN